MYCSYMATFEKLSDSEAGKLIKHIFRYVNDLNPSMDDSRLLDIIFEGIKHDLKEDLKKWEDKCIKNSENAKKGGAPKGNSNAKRKTTETTERLKKQPKQPDSDCDSDNEREREKENNPPLDFEDKTLKPLSECKNEILQDIQYLEIIAMNNHLGSSIEKSKEWVILFFKQLQNEGITRKSIQDFKSHFGRWLPIKLQQTNEKELGKQTTPTRSKF